MDKKYTLEEFVALFNDNSPNALWSKYTLVTKDNDTMIRVATDDEVEYLRNVMKEKSELEALTK